MRQQLLSLILIFFIFNSTYAQQVDNGAAPIWYNNDWVGVGVNTPFTSGSKLDVNGHIQFPINSSIGSNQAADYFSYNGSSIGHYSLGWYRVHAYVPPIGYFSAYNGINLFTNGTNRLSILHNGNVGFGITNPSTKLQVKGATQIIGDHDNWSGIILTTESSDEPKLGFRVSDNSERFKIKFLGVNGADERLGFIKGLNGEAEVFSVLKNGNVGIGTSAPSSTFEVKKHDAQSDMRVAVASFTFQGETHFGNQSEGQIVLGSQAYSNGTNKRAIIGYGPSNYIGGLLKFYTASSSDGSVLPRMIIDHNGRVGIGTDNPGNFKLAVEGTIGAREIKVLTTNPWPDYVFSSSYQLPSLTQVESYINENKHLPDVPSAKEVEKEGIDLGKMDATLLKKIEELTLYVIEQEKRIKELEQGERTRHKKSNFKKL